MTKKSKIILMAVSAVVIGTAVYYLQAISKSLCYYAGDAEQNFMELRELCYASYPEWEMILKSLLASIGAFLFLWIGTNFVLKMKKRCYSDKKSKN